MKHYNELNIIQKINYKSYGVAYMNAISGPQGCWHFPAMQLPAIEQPSRDVFPHQYEEPCDTNRLNTEWFR